MAENIVTQAREALGVIENRYDTTRKRCVGLMGVSSLLAIGAASPLFVGTATALAPLNGAILLGAVLSAAVGALGGMQARLSKLEGLKKVWKNKATLALHESCAKGRASDVEMALRLEQYTENLQALRFVGRFTGKELGEALVLACRHENERAVDALLDVDDGDSNRVWEMLSDKKLPTILLDEYQLEQSPRRQSILTKVLTAIEKADLPDAMKGFIKHGDKSLAKITEKSGSGALKSVQGKVRARVAKSLQEERARLSQKRAKRLGASNGCSGVAAGAAVVSCGSSGGCSCGGGGCGGC